MQKIKYLIFTSIFFLINAISYAQSISLNGLNLPPGFRIKIYANDVNNARELALAGNSIVFVGSTGAGKVYALIPKKNSDSAEVITIAKKLTQPAGVAYYQNNLYVAEPTKILVYKNILQHLKNPPNPETIFSDFPIIHTNVVKGILPIHTWKTIKFSPDGWLYVAVGMPCNVCITDDNRFGTIMRMKPDGSDAQIYVKGLRNSVGFDWHPVSHELWFTDNGRDWMGDDLPPDKLAIANKAGLDFGFPYYLGLDYQGKPLIDPDFGRYKKSTDGISWQIFSFPAHVAVLGMTFYTGKMFPHEYHHQIFVAEHGSWNRSKKVGYQVSYLQYNGRKIEKYLPFVSGWEKDGKVNGRPVDVLTMPDGSLLISDDYAGVVYRVIYP